MENKPLKILFVGDDERSVREVAEAMSRTGGAVEVSRFDAAVGRVRGDSFSAVVFEPAAVNAASLFQVTSLAVQAPQLPVIVLGSAADEAFAVQAISAGAQEFLAREEFSTERLERKIRCAIERQHERISLVAEKENYYGIFDHLVEGVFRTTTDGHYVLANMALARIYGYDSPAELMASITDIGTRLYVEPTRRQEFIQLMDQHDTLAGFESRIYRKDETIIWISENCRAVRDPDGRVMYYEGTVEDVTERKRAEDQIRRATGELSRSREELRAKNVLMEENLRMAREIQLTMLPQQYPKFPKTVAPEESVFQFVHRYQPAESVSGDFFSVSALSDYEAGMFICDVTGHGIRAALVTAMIRALSEELKPLARDPGMFLRKLNSDLCSILKSTGSPMLTTAFYAVADWQLGVVRFANAGHPKPLLIRRALQSVEPLPNASGHSQPALGLFDDPPYETTDVAIAPGDLLMLFTDGLYEVQGPNEELYSQQRLIVDVRNLIEKPTSELFDQLLEAICAFSLEHEFGDDVCLLGMEFTQKHEETG
ncbi:MAG: SpoIIE family protein phosphatase [Verrucomicrobia bacterium]|nr:SpoIIE family protein phosphatase [Verrucomicrobiota bacterium]